MGEFWDILDRLGNKTGKCVKRENFNRLNVGQYHLVVHIWMTNSEKQFLIQKRSKNKMPMPGAWAATGGAVKAGEDSKTAAIRELKEEMGITIKPNEIFFVKKFIRKNSILDIWHVGVDTDIAALELQKEEVSEAKWVARDELSDMIKNRKFHNYGDDYFKCIFALVE